MDRPSKRPKLEINTDGLRPFVNYRNPQDDDPSLHGETDAFRRAGRQRSYRDLIMVSTLAPCWYCSGLVRQFGFRTVIVGESRNFAGGLDWLRSADIQIIDLDSSECADLPRHLHPAKPRNLERGHRRTTTASGQLTFSLHLALYLSCSGCDATRSLPLGLVEANLADITLRLLTY